MCRAYHSHYYYHYGATCLLATHLATHGSKKRRLPQEIQVRRDQKPLEGRAHVCRPARCGNPQVARTCGAARLQTERGTGDVGGTHRHCPQHRCGVPSRLPACTTVQGTSPPAVLLPVSACFPPASQCLDCRPPRIQRFQTGPVCVWRPTLGATGACAAPAASSQSPHMSFRTPPATHLPATTVTTPPARDNQMLSMPQPRTPRTTAALQPAASRANSTSWRTRAAPGQHRRCL